MKQKSLRDKLDNILVYMLETLTSATKKPRQDARNVRNKTRLTTRVAKLFSTFAWGLDIIKENADLMKLWTDIENAKSAVLDCHGRNHGVARGGATDEFYRLMIRVKLLAQISGGDVETIISALSGLYEIEPSEINLYEMYPAKIHVLISENALPIKDMEIRELVGLLTKRLIAHGVGLDVIYKEEDFIATQYFFGGKPVSEYTRISFRPHMELPPGIISSSFRVGGKSVSEYSMAMIQTVLKEE